MLFDTDVLIWALRGHRAAAESLESDDWPAISVVSQIELLQGARDKNQSRQIQDFLQAAAVRVVPLTENIGHRATIYIQEHALKSGLQLADALITATAVENAMPLCTGNHRHFKAIADLEWVPFRP